jgi:ATP-dependent helicase/nuclease subunit A
MSDWVSSSSTVRLTDQQRRALEVREASVALSAGAGCGKTTVLTERFLAALEDVAGRPLRALVALTFTEKAARELRQRIRARCRAKLAAHEDVARWSLVLRGLDAAPVGTFHEFCARLLRRHAFLVGIDPDFAIFDESIAASLRDEAVRAALRRLLAARDLDLLDLASDYGLRQVREALGRLASLRAGGGPDAWSQPAPEAIVERWRALVATRLWPGALDRVAPLVAQCRRWLQELDSSLPKLRERRTVLLDSLPLLDPGRSPCPIERLHELVGLLRVADLPRKGSWPSGEVYEALKVGFASLREAIDDHIKPALVWDELQTRIASEQSLRFARLALVVRREYEQVKRRRRGLDFDDLLAAARELLRNHPEVVMPDRGNPRLPAIEFVLVDEFQDTDRLQSEILELLCGSEFLSGRLFVVGDVKQSIYGFRGAEPSIFRRWRAEFPEAGRLSLTENFRSVPGIIRFVNALFEGCFRDVEPAPVSGEGSGHQLLPIRREDTCQPSVEFLWPAPRDPSNEAEKAPIPTHTDLAGAELEVKRTAHERRVIEARGLARRLRERLDSGWTIFDRKRDELRPAHPGDIALLFRAMTDVWPYESALVDEGLDYHTIGGSAFYAQQEVHDVINLLSVVEDPFDEIALAGVLRSPFFDVSDEGLFWLATSFEDGGLTAGLHRLDEITELSPLDRQRTARGLQLLSRWRSLKDHEPMAGLVGRILDESGFEAALVCEFLGERKLANTRKLVRLARDFDRQGGFTLADLVARLRADLENEPREEQAATTEEAGASIRLMSIHQAKGLEFPIVVLPDLDRRPNNRSQLVAFHPELGLVVRPVQPVASSGESPADAAAPSLGWQTYLALARAEDEREGLRLFYVAATRARDALMISAGLAPDEPVKSSSAAMRLLDERFDRQTGRCRGSLHEPDLTSAVQVRVMKPSGPRGARGTPSPRPADRNRDGPGAVSISAIEETITRTEHRDRPEPERLGSIPRYLDLDPAEGLPPRAARLDRLIRSILEDPHWLRGPALEDIAAHAAARQTPAANAALIRDALRRMAPWSNEPIFQALRAADPATIIRNLAFTMPFPLAGESTIVFHGTCDVIYRDLQGRWHVIVVADARVCRARQRLRLQISGLAAYARGLAPVHQGWLIRHGPGGEINLETESGFDADAVARAFADLCAPPP